MHLSSLLLRARPPPRLGSDEQQQQQQQEQEQGEEREQQQQRQTLPDTNNSSNRNSNSSNDSNNSNNNIDSNDGNSNSSSSGSREVASPSVDLIPGLGGGLGTLIGADFAPHRWFLSGLNVWQGGKGQLWGLLALALLLAAISTSIFEAERLTTHVLRSPCTITGSEVVDIGTCTICDDGDPGICEVHPIATARIAVNYLPMHHSSNVTGWVWYCRAHNSGDPCRRGHGWVDDSAANLHETMGVAARRGHIPCSVGDVHTFLRTRAIEGRHHNCYYTSQDLSGEDVWFSMPSPGDVDHAWFERHLQYPAMLALGGLVLLSTLLGCLALEGAELWASGLAP